MSDEQAQRTVRVERVAVGVQALGGVILTLSLLLIADMRSSIQLLGIKVEEAIKDVAILRSQRLEERLSKLEIETAKLHAELAVLKRPQ